MLPASRGASVLWFMVYGLWFMVYFGRKTVYTVFNPGPLLNLLLHRHSDHMETLTRDI